MRKNNKLNKTFGPFSTAGIVLIFAMLCMIFENKFTYSYRPSRFEANQMVIISVCLFIIGVFIAFSATYTKIDYTKKRIKYGTKLFGIFLIGKWTYLTSDMKLGLKKTTENWGAASQTNRTTSFDYTNWKIMLYDGEDTEIIPIKQSKKKNLAEAELEKLSELLDLNIIN